MIQGCVYSSHNITKRQLLFSSCTTETPSRALPIFMRVQLLSICWLAWRKYRPSVHIAACCSVTMAVPAHHDKQSMQENVFWNSYKLVYYGLSVTRLIGQLCLYSKTLGQKLFGQFRETRYTQTCLQNYSSEQTLSLFLNCAKVSHCDLLQMRAIFLEKYTSANIILY